MNNKENNKLEVEQEIEVQEITMISKWLTIDKNKISMITKTKKTSLILLLHQEETSMIQKIMRDQVTDVSTTDNRGFKTVVKRTFLRMISNRNKKTSMGTSNNNPEEKRETSKNKKIQKTWMMKLTMTPAWPKELPNQIEKAVMFTRTIETTDDESLLC